MSTLKEVLKSLKASDLVIVNPLFEDVATVKETLDAFDNTALLNLEVKNIKKAAKYYRIDVKFTEQIR